MLVVYLIKTTMRLNVNSRQTVDCATSAEKHCLKMALPLVHDSRTNRYKMWTASKSGDNENKLRTVVDSSRKHLDKPRIQHSLCIILSFAKRKHLCLTCFQHFRPDLRVFSLLYATFSLNCDFNIHKRGKYRRRVPELCLCINKKSWQLSGRSKKICVRYINIQCNFISENLYDCENGFHWIIAK